MNFELSPDEEAIQESLRRFVEDNCALPPTYGVGEPTPGTHWDALAELGWIGATIPEEFGGLGMGAIEAAIIMSEFGRGLADEPFMVSALLAPELLIRSGAETICAQLLPDIASGIRRIAIALTEPGDRFEMTAPSARATVTADSARITGHKTLIVDAATADAFIVSAGTANCAEALFLVARDASGVRITGYRTFEGRAVADLLMQDTPATPISLDRDATRRAIEAMIDMAALMQSAEAFGCIEKAIEIAAHHLAERQQFGHPLAGFQVLQHRMADLFIDLEMARSHLHAGLSALAAGGAEAHRAASATKVAVMQAAKRVTGEAVHLHGAAGMTVEYAIGHYYRRSVALEKSFGDTDYHRRRFIQESETLYSTSATTSPAPAMGVVVITHENDHGAVVVTDASGDRNVL